MSNKINILKKYIQEVIKEMTTSGSIAGYSTPFAFSKKSITPKKKVKRFTKSTPGFTIAEPKRTMSVDEKYLEQDYLYENNLYSKYKNNYRKTNSQKIDEDTNKIILYLNSIENLIYRMNKLKKDVNIQSDEIGNRVKNRISKIEKKLIELLNDVKNLI